MSYIPAQVAGASGPANLNYARAVLNLNGGAGSNLIAHGTAHTRGNWVSLGVAPADLAGLDLQFFDPSGTGVRYMYSLSLDAGATTFLDDEWLGFGSAIGAVDFAVPRAIPNGGEVWATVRASVGGADVWVLASGWLPVGSDNPPALTIADNTLTPPNTGSTQLSASAAVTTDPTAFTTLKDPTDHAYKAFLFTWATYANPTARNVVFRFAVGDAGSEVVIAAYPYPLQGSAVSNGRGSFLVYAEIPAGERISVNVLGTAPADTIFFGVTAFR